MLAWRYLGEIYGYVEWRSRQRSRDLWNVASASFYEHLVDEKPPRREIPTWVKPAIFEGLMDLFERRLGKAGEKNLHEVYAQARRRQ